MIIDGKAAASRLCAGIAAQVASLCVVPRLAVVLVGNDAASDIYVNARQRRTEEGGIRSFKHVLPADTTEAELLALIATLNGDDVVHGILVQFPLPAHLDSALVINAIAEATVPCTPLGAMLLLRAVTALRGKHAVVVGRSNIVGKPMAQMLLAADCSVTVVHSRTPDIAGMCRMADVLVVAVGRAGMVKPDWIKPGATVIDVGIDRIDGRVVGDVDPAAGDVAGAIAPVPSGVGPTTIASLLANSLAACCRKHGLAAPQLLAA